MTDDKDNVIRVVFNSEKREGDEQDLHAMDLMDNYIRSFMNDPPTTDFQLGYLYCAVDLLKEMGGEDYTQLAHTYAKRMHE